MKEQLITFETVKLAKEKGFNIPSHSYYFEDGEFKEFEIQDNYGFYGYEYTVNREEFYENWNNNWKTTKEGNKCFGCDKNPNYLETFSAPTQSLLQKWLREVHSIDIHIESYRKHSNKVYGQQVLYGEFIPTDTGFRRKTARKNSIFITFKTYEEALEKGLLEGLKLIK